MADHCPTRTDPVHVAGSVRVYIKASNLCDKIPKFRSNSDQIRWPKMPAGTLEVLLVSAKGLENTDFIFNMDPYVILTCRSQEKKSGVASGQGSEPEWNETFAFTISEGAEEITLKILDSDKGTQDDFVGQVTIPLEPVYLERSLPATAYSVVKDEEFRGEIRVGLTFCPEERMSRDYQVEEEYGGWKQSSYAD